MESKSPVNSRLRRKVARAVTLALEQDSRKWKEGLIQLQDRVDWLQWQKGGGGHSKMWTSGASGSQDHGLFSDGGSGKTVHVIFLKHRQLSPKFVGT